jgi:hypothetical protein
MAAFEVEAVAAAEAEAETAEAGAGDPMNEMLELRFDDAELDVDADTELAELDVDVDNRVVTEEDFDLTEAELDRADGNWKSSESSKVCMRTRFAAGSQVPDGPAVGRVSSEKHLFKEAVGGTASPTSFTAESSRREDLAWRLRRV